MNESKAQRRLLSVNPRLLVLAVCMGSGFSSATQTAEAESQEPDIRPGMQCIAADGWWSLDRQLPKQPEPVRITKLQAMVSSEPGAWVQPLRGPMTGHQYLIAMERLSACKS